MDEGEIVIDSIELIRLQEITTDLAMESGFESRADLLKVAKHGSGGKRVFGAFPLRVRHSEACRRGLGALPWLQAGAGKAVGGLEMTLNFGQRTNEPKFLRIERIAGFFGKGEEAGGEIEFPCALFRVGGIHGFEFFFYRFEGATTAGLVEIEGVESFGDRREGGGGCYGVAGGVELDGHGVHEGHGVRLLNEDLVEGPV